MGRIVRILWLAGTVPIMLVAFFWVRSHWWIDNLSRKGGGGTITLRTDGGLAASWNASDPLYLWWTPPPEFYLFDAPEWELRVGEDPEANKARWFGFGTYAGADFTWSAGSSDWSAILPWWSLAIMSGIWGWLMLRTAQWLKKRQLRELSLVKEAGLKLQPLGSSSKS